MLISESYNFVNQRGNLIPILLVSRIYYI